MNFSNPAWFMFFCVLCLDLAIASIFIFMHWQRKLIEKQRQKARRIVVALLENEKQDRKMQAKDEAFLHNRMWLFLEECTKIIDSIKLNGNQQEALRRLLARNKIDVLLIRHLNSNNKYLRLRAAAYLPLVPSTTICTAMIHALEREHNRLIKLFIVNGLTKIGAAIVIIPSIIDCLANEPIRFQKRIWGLLSDLGDDLAGLVPLFKQRREKEIKLLLVHFALCYRSIELQEYLEALVDSEDLDIAHAAFRVLTAAYTASIRHEKYLTHPDFLIRNLAAESLGSLPGTESIDLLFKYMNDPVIRNSVSLALTAILRSQPRHFNRVMHHCLKEERPCAHDTIIDVLSNFVNYLQEKLVSADADLVECILFEIVQQGKLKDFIGFLNQNANPEIRQRSLSILRWLMQWEPTTEKEQEYKAKSLSELKLYLKEHILDELGLLPEQKSGKRIERKDRPRLPLLYLFLIIGIAAVPASSLIFSFFTPSAFDSLQTLQFLRLFFSYFNSSFAVYAGCLNMIYILLLGFSFAEVSHQSRINDLLYHSFLFKEYILPSISIITPAFNEEASIVESVNSLLTLRYPDYEIIVINDGSTDATLEKLVAAFELERTDIFIHGYLNTQEIRGVYANKRYPELLVIDKVNGGKADSLNAGLNIAQKEYFAGIDADSLLERDALLNLSGLFLYSEEEVVAAGGNIFPVNGCTVRKGALITTKIPGSTIARFQTIEYLRAFMAGRVGWAATKLLLIISGAFGVFHHRKVINVHGYLTQSQHYMKDTHGKDTVGEDMELVVRLIRELRESGTPFSVRYGYNANCWTEIPETMKVLSGQRDRWQRGLLDIITFHSHMLFNPRYGKIGLLSFPYFLIFEVLGPWFETEGYLVLAASLILGWIHLPLFLVVFTATILLGIFVSFASLILAEFRKDYFSMKDKFRLILFAFLENFGFRQFMSLLRLRGYFSMLAKVAQWGQMDRRGIGSPGKKQEGVKK